MKKILILTCMLCTLSFSSSLRIPQYIFSKLQASQKLLAKNELSKASNILENLLKKDLSKPSKSYVLQSLANIAIRKDDYKKAIKYYEEIKSYNVFPKSEMQKIRFSLSQLYLAEQKYSKSISYSLSLLKEKYPNKIEIYKNLALAYFYSKKYTKSIKYINLGLEKAKDKIYWYKMLYSSYIEIKQYSKALNIMKKLIQYDKTNENYWLQLTSLYQTLGKYKKSLATVELAYKSNILNKKKNLLFFVNILVQNDVYNKAALILEDGLKRNILEKNKKNFDLLVSSFLNAKNYKKALPLLENSDFANTDKYKILLANILYNKNKYKEAIKVLENYKFTKDSSFDGKRYTLLALSYYELDKIADTKKYLKKASLNFLCCISIIPLFK